MLFEVHDNLLKDTTALSKQQDIEAIQNVLTFAREKVEKIMGAMKKEAEAKAAAKKAKKEREAFKAAYPAVVKSFDHEILSTKLIQDQKF